MKHIINYKLFEGLSHLITDDLYYEFSSVEQFDEIVNTEVKDKISESEINTINRLVYKYVSNYGYNYGHSFKAHHNMSPSGIKNRKLPIENDLLYYTGTNNISQELRVTIYKFNDSYWAVEVEHYHSCSFRWFVCDDIEGLTNLFTEIEIPN